MKILVSACLLGKNCKYNGGNNLCKELTEYLEQNKCEVVAVCPEVAGGLPVPRVPSEIVNGVVTNREGKIVDAEFRRGAEQSLEFALREKVDVAVLQSRSPSCGAKMIYDGSFSGKLKEGQGIFASLLNEYAVRIIDVEDFLNDKAILLKESDERIVES